MHCSSQEQNHAHSSPKTQTMMNQYHVHAHLSNQCGSSLIRFIDAPLPLVWSLVRKFDNPKLYKRFIKTCTMVHGDGGIGSIREIKVVSGLPEALSRERLDVLDDEAHMMIFSMIGCDHRLVNYQSTTTLHEEEVKDRGMTILIESYVVDVPMDSNKEDTCCFADTIIGCNLKSLAILSEKMAIRGPNK